MTLAEPAPLHEAARLPVAARARALGVRLLFSAQMAAHGILANPLRSALTILGVAIGVASVVSLMAIGEGARQAVLRQFAGMGTNVVVMRARHPSAEFRPEEAAELPERVSGLTAATPVVQTKAPLRWRRTRGQADVVGVNELFPLIRDHPLAAGHFFTRWHVRQRSPVAVLGHDLAVALVGGRNPVGRTFTLGGRTFRVVGVLTKKESGGESPLEGTVRVDEAVLVPYTAALQLDGRRTVTEMWAKARSPRDADLAVVQLGRIYRRKLGLDQRAPVPVAGGPGSAGAGVAGGAAFLPGMPFLPPGMPFPMPEMMMGGMGPGGPGGAVPDRRTPAEILASGEEVLTITSLNRLVREADKANRVMTLLLGGIAAVSLLVGGLGIMNIMLVAVAERTAEIGLRRALGATQGDLLAQFVLEALYLSGIGAIGGTAAGLWGADAVGRYGLDTAVSGEAVAVATGVALACGLLFGIYPALTASSLPPVQALRR